MQITPAETLVHRAKAEITSLSPADTAERARAGAVLVDLRDVRELEKAGRIPGAVHAPRGMLEFWVDPASPYHRRELHPARPLILFCAAAWRSALACKALQDMGVPDVAEMEGGFSAWKKAGLPVER